MDLCVQIDWGRWLKIKLFQDPLADDADQTAYVEKVLVSEQLEE